MRVLLPDRPVAHVNRVLHLESTCDLPPDSSDDLVRVAKRHIDVDPLNIVVVGDRATIEEALRKAGITPIVYLDIEGRPVPAAP
jgi:hypothetical protein